MRNLVLFVGCILYITFVSCKKDKQIIEEPEEEAPAASYPNYSALKVGNYWIYQRFNVDTSGNETPTSMIDSCYIQKDTLIHNNTYYKYISPNTYVPNNPNSIATEFLRDSLSYLINSNGHILFSSQDFTTTFYPGYITASPTDTVCKVTNNMTDHNVTTSVPAGNFITSCFRETYSFYPNYQTCKAIRTKNLKYAENVGKIAEGFGFYLNICDYQERRLIRYHLN